jgi:hypothetical protein
VFTESIYRIPIYSQVNLTRVAVSCLFKAQFNIILSSIPRYSLPFRFSHQNYAFTYHVSIHSECPTHLMFLNFDKCMFDKGNYEAHHEAVLSILLLSPMVQIYTLTSSI